MYSQQTDHGPGPYIADIRKAAIENDNYRTAFWTGGNLQMTLMSIPPNGEIGMEVHPDTDQFIRVEQGSGIARFGRSMCGQENCQYLNQGDAVFVPAGVWHNIMNCSNCPLKLSSIYAPPHHKRGIVQPTAEDAERAEY